MCLSFSSRRRCAADSGVMSRCGVPNISYPTMNLRTVAERSKRRVVVGVKMPLLVCLTVGRSLVEAHRVWERCFKQVVVARRQTLHEIGERVFLRIVHLIEAPEMSAFDITSVSNGHTAQNGTTAMNASFWQTMRLPSDSSIFRYSQSRHRARVSPEIAKRSQFLLVLVRQSLFDQI